MEKIRARIFYTDQGMKITVTVEISEPKNKRMTTPSMVSSLPKSQHVVITSDGAIFKNKNKF